MSPDTAHKVACVKFIVLSLFDTADRLILINCKSYCDVKRKINEPSSFSSHVWRFLWQCGRYSAVKRAYIYRLKHSTIVLNEMICIVFGAIAFLFSCNVSSFADIFILIAHFIFVSCFLCLLCFATYLVLLLFGSFTHIFHLWHFIVVILLSHVIPPFAPCLWY